MDDLFNNRILIIDDTQSIHDDFKKILLNEEDAFSRFEDLEKTLFDTEAKGNLPTPISYIMDSAYQGQEALELVSASVRNKQPYALAFVDIRMPPGWDGIVTIQKLWEVDPDLQIVICTAYSDYSWEETIRRLNNPHSFLILKKPFDIVEIRQLAATLTMKWQLKKQVEYQIQNLQSLVVERTAKLDKVLSLIGATLESTQEGIIAFDLEGKVVTYNQMFLQIWSVSADLVKSNKLDIILQELAVHTTETSLFLSMMHDLCTSPRISHMREWKINVNTTLEIYTHPQYLNDVIVGVVFSFRDITVQKNAEAQLLHQAMHDNLTDLPNRALLTDRIKQSIISAKRFGKSIGILLVDLDNFKHVNDSLGHSAGDSLLKMISKQLKSYIREADTISRFGGDEFVVVISTVTKEEDLVVVANDLLEIFLTPYEIEKHSLIVTVSIGISMYPKDGQDSETLLKNADAALYSAKEHGKNSYQFYRSEFNDNILYQAELTTALRQALKKKELFLHYQPLLNLNSGTIVGVEALLRWTNPIFGQLNPETFIPLAEKTGLILSIGEWVLRTACLQCKDWQRSICPELSIAVNISPYQFQQNNFIEFVQKILKETKLDPKCLELEITESMILGNVTESSIKMVELKKIGVSLSMDDFGTGYASLNYLKCFTFDKIKIDKSFIDGIPTNKDDQAIVEAIINMTKTMGLEVIAEGVEEVEQVNFLRKNHSNQVQGYYFSRPVSVDGISELLLSQSDTHKPSTIKDLLIKSIMNG